MGLSPWPQRWPGPPDGLCPPKTGEASSYEPSSPWRDPGPPPRGGRSPGGTGPGVGRPPRPPGVSKDGLPSTSFGENFSVRKIFFSVLGRFFFSRKIFRVKKNFFGKNFLKKQEIFGSKKTPKKGGVLTPPYLSILRKMGVTPPPK